MEINRENLLNLIRTELAARKLSISALERQAAVAKDTIRDFLRGKTQILRADKLQKILKILQPEEKISISGSLGKDAEVYPTENDQGSLLDCPPGFAHNTVKAVRVDSDAMFPVFQKGWIIYYGTDGASLHGVAEPSVGWQVPYNKPAKGDGYAEFIDKPCIVKTTDGKTFVRTLKRGSSPDKYTLVGYNSPDIQDVQVEWVGKIVFIKT